MGEENTTQEVKRFTLPERKVIVKFIKRKRGMAAGDHITEDHVISGGMLDKATKRYQAPLKKNGSIANVLTNAEKEELENITGLNLSVYGDYWKEFFVSLRKEDNELDLSNPVDYMSYAVLRALENDLIAPSWNKRNDKLTYQFVITEPGAELRETKKKYDAKKQAFKLYGKLEDDKPQLLGVLKLLTNKPVSANSKLDWLQTKVEQIIDETPSKFVNLIQNPAYHTMLLVHKGLDNGVVIRNGNKYATADGLDLCEADETATFNNALKYLDDPKNQDVRALIEAKINNAE